jgi:hypothetical protein
MPALDVLPFEQASTNFRLSGHTSTGQINFFLREDPKGGFSNVMAYGNHNTYQLGFARLGSWGIATAVQTAQGNETHPHTL